MKSLRAAIDAKCADCTYDPLAGGTRLQQIIDCTCVSCPLYPVRPQRSPSKQKQLQAQQASESLSLSGEHERAGTTPRQDKETA